MVTAGLTWRVQGDYLGSIPSVACLVKFICGLSALLQRFTQSLCHSGAALVIPYRGDYPRSHSPVNYRRTVHRVFTKTPRGFFQSENPDGLTSYSQPGAALTTGCYRSTGLHPPSRKSP